MLPYTLIRALALPVIVATAVTARAEPDAQRKQELREMVAQDCGSCHGGTLRGGLGPALTPEALKDRDPRMLARVILDGRHGTPMAPWKLFVNESEAEWLARQLQSGKLR